jgi:hypothetical protein
MWHFWIEISTQFLLLTHISAASWPLLGYGSLFGKLIADSTDKHNMCQT